MKTIASKWNEHFADDIERLLQAIAKAPVRIALLMMFAAFFFGGAAYSFVEKDTSLIDGWYWATVVMPTVGFGDFSPQTIPGRWLYIYVVASGWFGTLILGGALAGAITQRRIESHGDTVELDDDFDFLITHLERMKAICADKDVVEAMRKAALK